MVPRLFERDRTRAGAAHGDEDARREAGGGAGAGRRAMARSSRPIDGEGGICAATQPADDGEKSTRAAMRARTSLDRETLQRQCARLHLSVGGVTDEGRRRPAPFPAQKGELIPVPETKEPGASIGWVERLVDAQRYPERGKINAGDKPEQHPQC